MSRSPCMRGGSWSFRRPAPPVRGMAAKQFKILSIRLLLTRLADHQIGDLRRAGARTGIWARRSFIRRFGAAGQTLRSRPDELTLAFLGLLRPTRRFQETADGQGFLDSLVARFSASG